MRQQVGNGEYFRRGNAAGELIDTARSWPIVREQARKLAKGG